MSVLLIGMDEIGIYRLSGIASEIRSLKKLFNERKLNYFMLACKYGQRWFESAAY